MTEKEFLTLYKERRNLKSIREAKERLDSFWKALFDVLDVEEKVIIKDWGIFEKREVKPRKILNLATRKMMMTEEKKVIKFKPRMKMIDKVNELNTLIEEEYEQDRKSTRLNSSHSTSSRMPSSA